MVCRPLKVAETAGAGRMDGAQCLYGLPAGAVWTPAPPGTGTHVGSPEVTSTTIAIDPRCSARVGNDARSSVCSSMWG